MKLFRLPATSGPGTKSLIWPVLTNNADHQAVNHFQFSSFWMQEQVFLLFHWKDNPVCLTVLVSLEILWAQGSSCYAPNKGGMDWGRGEKEVGGQSRRRGWRGRYSQDVKEINLLFKT